MVDLRPAPNSTAGMPGAADHDAGFLTVLPRSIRGSVSAMAAWVGAGTALIGSVVAVVLVVMTWVLDSADYGSSAGAIKAGLLTFVAANHSGVRIDGVNIGFVPLGLLALPVWLCWRGGQGLGSALVALRADADGLLPISVVRRAWLVAAGSYAVVISLVAMVARIGTTSASPLSAFLGALVIALLGFGAGLHRGAGLFDLLAMRVNWRAWAILRAGFAAAAILFAAGVLLALGSLLAHAGTAMDLSSALAGGAGGLPLALLGALCVPNAGAAGAAYLAGPGFSVGTGTHVSAFEVTHGTVPAFPLFAALPSGNGANLLAFGLMFLAPIAAGLVVVASLLRAGRWTVLSLSVAAAGSGAITGIALGIVAALSGGSLGDQALRSVGPAALPVMGLVAAEVAVVAVAVAIGRSVWSRRLAVDPAAGTSESAANPDSDPVTD